MRWLRYSLGTRTAYGILEGERVLDVRGDPFAGYEKTGQIHALSDVKIELPVVPGTFYEVGFNYPEHVREIAAKQGIEPNLPTQPDVGYRANSGLIAHGEAIVVPRDATDAIQYEGELVAVVGRTAKGLSEEDALSCLLGFTIGNDVSERSWQKSDKTLWRAKNTDTFAPMGPWIETGVGDLDELVTTVRVNGEVSSQFPTNAMLFGVAKFLSKITRYITLRPGDVLWMGTDGTSPNLSHGDVVDVEISGIGVLTNPIVKL